MFARKDNEKTVTDSSYKSDKKGALFADFLQVADYLRKTVTLWKKKLKHKKNVSKQGDQMTTKCMKVRCYIAHAVV